MTSTQDIRSTDATIPDDLDPKEVKVTLVKAEHLIQHPENWVKGTMVDATTRDPKTGERLYRYCAYGALDKVLIDEYQNNPDRRTRILRAAMGFLNSVAQKRLDNGSPPVQAAIVSYNDGDSSHGDIISAFREAERQVAKVIAERGKS